MLNNGTTLTHTDKASQGLKLIVESIDNCPDFKTYMKNYLFTHGSIPRHDGAAAPTADAVAAHAVHHAREAVVGLSDINRIEPVVLFLSQLCTSGCAIIAGLRWLNAFGIALDCVDIVDDWRTHMMELGNPTHAPLSLLADPLTPSTFKCHLLSRLQRERRHQSHIQEPWRQHICLLHCCRRVSIHF